MKYQVSKGKKGGPREDGAITKDWGGRLPVALIYPNTYFLGMSNLGMHTIYKLFNANLRTVCERVFHEPSSHKPPLAIESGRPLADFAVLAFSISYELDYFNVVNILKASGIPLFAKDRDERHPLVMAGGPCVTANPAPLSPFFDCFCLGEAEAILPQLIPTLQEGFNISRGDLLKTLSKLPGIYAPSVPTENPIKRQFAPDIDEFDTATAILTPDTELGDLFLIEVERGCARGCRFCLVHGNYAPMRFRSVDRIVACAREGLPKRRRLGLMGPAVTDHPRIAELLTRLNGIGAELSLSSMRINNLNKEVLDELAKGKAETITIAPEAGSQRLRDVVNKGISEDDILSAVDRLGDYRFKQLKLYFIVGLPTETDEDVQAIVKLAHDIKDRFDKRGSPMRITLNASPFVPKANTPFQWLPMASQETLQNRMAILRSSLPLKGIKLNEESPAWTRVQGVLSRGDNRVADALDRMHEVSLAGWQRVVDLLELDLDYYVNRKWDTKQPLPWGMVDSGMSEERLCGELEKALLPQ
ncbi:MAG TPA: radical SAM protein [Dehalococcoidales bacterium]|nr:radical SAM protein [Dehalococcoidales bacterium]